MWIRGEYWDQTASDIPLACVYKLLGVQWHERSFTAHWVNAKTRSEYLLILSGDYRPLHYEGGDNRFHVMTPRYDHQGLLCGVKDVTSDFLPNGTESIPLPRGVQRFEDAKSFEGTDRFDEILGNAKRAFNRCVEIIDSKLKVKQTHIFSDIIREGIDNLIKAELARRERNLDVWDQAQAKIEAYREVLDLIERTETERTATER